MNLNGQDIRFFCGNIPKDMQPSDKVNLATFTKAALVLIRGKVTELHHGNSTPNSRTIISLISNRTHGVGSRITRIVQYLRAVKNGLLG